MTYLIIQLNGADAVIARFSRRGRGLSFLQGTRRPLPESGAFSELLAGFDKTESGETVILSMPPAAVHSRVITLPISDRIRLREILPLELAGEIAVSPEDTSFDALPMGADAHLAVWCRREEIASLIKELASAGIEPEIVTSSVLHWNLLLPPGADEACAVTDGHSMMIGTPSGPLLARPLPATQGEREFSRTLAAFEISHDKPVSGILRIGELSGSECTLQADQALIETFAGDRQASLDLAGAYAAAKAAISGDIVNFRSGSMAYTAGHLKIIRRLRMTAILAAILVLLLFTETGVRYYLLHRDVNSLDASIGKIYRGIFPTRKKPIDPVGEVKSEIRRLAGGDATRRILPLLRTIAEAKGEEVTGFYDAEIDGSRITLKGDAKSVNDFKARAAKSLATAEISEIKSKSDGTVSFVFRGTIKEGN